VTKADPFFAWPGWAHLRFAVQWGMALTVWFILVFGGAEYVTAQRSFRVRLHLTAELGLPFVPEMVLGYMAIYPVLGAAPFILRNQREIAALIGTLAAVIAVGGIGFLIFPGELLFQPPADLGVWTGLVRFAKHMALRHNLMPSLHVALSTVCLLAYASRACQVAKLMLGLVAVVIGVAALLLHQHYLVDVVTGYGLAWVATRWIYQSLAQPPSA
jgi:membrane-associated phospholipid phosphatase